MDTGLVFPEIVEDIDIPVCVYDDGFDEEIDQRDRVLAGGLLVLKVNRLPFKFHDFFSSHAVVGGHEDRELKRCFLGFVPVHDGEVLALGLDESSRRHQNIASLEESLFIPA